MGETGVPVVSRLIATISARSHSPPAGHDAAGNPGTPDRQLRRAFLIVCAVAVFRSPRRYGPPRLQGVLPRLPADQSASTYPASRNSLRPRWRYARSGPHKSLGVERRFLNQASEAPFDCQAISSSPSRKHPRRPAFSPDRRTPYAALGIPVATNRSTRRRTAQAILASLLAKATTATLRWARSSSAFAHRPSGVSRSAT